MGKIEAEVELAEFRAWMVERDDMVRRARAAGLSFYRIAALSGLARMTVRKIVAEGSEDSHA